MVWQTVNPATSELPAACCGVASRRSSRGLRGDAADGRPFRTFACLEGSLTAGPRCRNCGTATVPRGSRCAGAFGGVRRTMVRAALNVGVGG